MDQRLAGVLGSIATGIAAVGLLAPQAAADAGWKVLAPGVGCGALICRNDSDKTYRIEWVASCVNVGRPDSLVPARTWVRPHTQIGMTSVTCPVVQLPGSWVRDAPVRVSPYTYVRPRPRWVEGAHRRGVVGFGQYNRAVVDNSGR